MLADPQPPSASCALCRRDEGWNAARWTTADISPMDRIHIGQNARDFVTRLFPVERESSSTVPPPSDKTHPFRPTNRFSGQNAKTPRAPRFPYSILTLPAFASNRPLVLSAFCTLHSAMLRNSSI